MTSEQLIVNNMRNAMASGSYQSSNVYNDSCSFLFTIWVVICRILRRGVATHFGYVS